MPKPTLERNQGMLESQIIETMLAGLNEWRPDLHYPESHSDMQACVRGLMRMFEIKRRPLVASLKIECGSCEGIGHFIEDTPACRNLKTCSNCNGRGYTTEKVS